MRNQTSGDPGDPWLGPPAVTRDLTHDAVVVVPGIMGSALADATTGKVLWGLRPETLASAWVGKDRMRPLHMDDAERSGDYGRVVATGLLRVPAWAPFLRGFEPYGDLVRAARGSVADPAAVLEFPYDWRLPVAHNGRLLVEAAYQHLDAWRNSDAHRVARLVYGDDREARLVFVAHSMGGLVVRAAFAHAADIGSDLTGDTRAVVTLGTPFLGSAKAAVILNGSRSQSLSPLPRWNMQALAATLPGVHDLLPDYRCVDAGPAILRLTPADVERLGGDRELAARAQQFQQQMRSPLVPAMPGHRKVVGVAQPTVQSVRLEGGLVHEQYVSFEADGHGELKRHLGTGIPVRKDRAGDGTVYRDAATLLDGNGPTTWLPLQHGALAKDSVALDYVRAVLTDHERGPALGGGGMGLDLPDSASVGQPWWLRLLPEPGTVLDTYAGIACTLHQAVSDDLVAVLRLGWADGVIAARVVLPAPGLYRVRVDTGDRSSLTQLVLAIDPVGTG